MYSNSNMTLYDIENIHKQKIYLMKPKNTSFHTIITYYKQMTFGKFMTMSFHTYVHEYYDRK